MTQDTASLTEIPAPGANTRKVFIKTYGCQMNVYDSGRMADALAADGYAPTEVMEEADLVLLNTCHIREKAAEKGLFPPSAACASTRRPVPPKARSS